MAELTVPRVDFSSLGDLPQIWKQGRQDALRQQTLASLGQGTDVDANALLKSGDLSLAQLGVAMRNRSSDDIWRQQEAARQASQFQQTLNLQKQKFAADQDKTPTNFVADPTDPSGYRPIGPADPAYQEKLAAAKARAAAAQPPEGFTRGADGSLSPISGGSTDPEYMAKVEAAKARARGDVPTIIGPGSSVITPNKAAEGPIYTNKLAAGGGLSQNALDIRAAQWNNGDYEGATKNVGRGAQGGATLEAIANRAAERLVDQGYSPDAAAAMTSANMQKFKAAGIGANAESRTGATREANLNIILKAADAAIPAALEASEKISRTGFVPLNKIIQGGQVMTSNPELRQFGMANLQLAEHWARAMNPTGVMRESDRDMALHFLSLADTKDTYKQAVMQLKTQITRERDAIRSSTPGHGTPQPAAAAPSFNDRFNGAETGPVVVDGYTIRAN